MPKVTGEATGRGNHCIEVYYGGQFSTKTFHAALVKVKGFLVEASRAGMEVGKILHYKTDRKKEIPDEIDFNTNGVKVSQEG